MVFFSWASEGPYRRHTACSTGTGPPGVCFSLRHAVFLNLQLVISAHMVIMRDRNNRALSRIRLQTTRTSKRPSRITSNLCAH